MITSKDRNVNLETKVKIKRKEKYKEIIGADK